MNRTLILVSGLMCDETVWAHQRESLSRCAYVQVAAKGTSDSLGAMAEAILVSAPERFLIAGHSMGGRVALEVVRRAPERVEALALLDTGYAPLAPGEAGMHEAEGRYALLQKARQEGMRLMGRDWLRGMVHPSRLGDGALLDPILDMIARNSVDIFNAQIQALLTRPDATPVLRSLTCPTLVLCGREDTWAPLRRHQEMCNLIPKEHLIERAPIAIPDCGHMSTLERPAEVNNQMLSWLEATAS